jgi:hypothetical protein
METIVLTHISEDGISTQATFLPEHGMNLISYKRGEIEVIDPSTKEGFDQRSAGLGPLIGPHFHRRQPDLIPKIDNEPEFPQSAYCKENGITDYFSHGVARYVPWKFEKFENGFKAEISGKDLWKGVPLATIEGQNFQMKMEASLDHEGLKIILSVVSDTDSIVGLHYFYRLPEGKGVVKSHIKDEQIEIPLTTSLDKNFRPFPHPRYGHIVLETSEYILKTDYECISEENSWQLYHPEGASFVCIEPLSAQDPRHPNLSVSSLTIRLKIEPV